MMEIRKLMPPLTELLMPDQIRIARNGTDAEKLALFDSLDAEKRQQVIRSLGPQALVNLPNLRRESMAVGQPQVYVNSELVDNKLLRALYSNRQLEEVLVDFWMNHFNVFNGKGPERLLLTSFAWGRVGEIAAIAAWVAFAAAAVMTALVIAGLFHLVRQHTS